MLNVRIFHWSREVNFNRVSQMIFVRQRRNRHFMFIFHLFTRFVRFMFRERFNSRFEDWRSRSNSWQSLPSGGSRFRFNEIHFSIRSLLRDYPKANVLSLWTNSTCLISIQSSVSRSRFNSGTKLFRRCVRTIATPARSDHRGTWKKDMNYSQGKLSLSVSLSHDPSRVSRIAIQPVYNFHSILRNATLIRTYVYRHEL